MPPPPIRKKPYSGKKKRLQLQEKKARKAREEAELNDAHSTETSPENVVPESSAISHANPKDNGSGRRLISQFEKLSPEELHRARLQSMKPFTRLPQTALEIGEDSFAETIDFPRRPQWNRSMSKEELEAQEQEYFDRWVTEVYEKHGKRDDGRQLSLFERNLEVWRQLWRVLEMSDIVLVVMDIRHPLLHFPRTLYDYVTKDLKRKMVGIFNKTDLVSPFTVFAWRRYFEKHFPELHIACFSCFPGDPKLVDDTTLSALKSRMKRPRRRYFHARGVRDLLHACQDVHLEKQGVRVDWAGLIQRYDDANEEQAEPSNESHHESDEESDTSTTELEEEFNRVLDIESQQVTPHKDYITLGLVGHPNVGKSSLINSIMQRTVVSTSRTPGHTKHFQTIHLCENVRLCDSPGLVFPTLLPRALQILSGMYPIAQVQEPYSVVQYLAERIPLEKILSLTPPHVEAKDLDTYQWTAWDICDAYAILRGFHTNRGARTDVSRAANAILQLATDGRILLSFKPEGFFSSSQYEQLWVQDTDARKQLELQRQKEQDEQNKRHSESDKTESDTDEPPVLIEKSAFSVLLEEDE